MPQGTEISSPSAARNQCSSGFVAWGAGLHWSPGGEVGVLLELGWYSGFQVACSGASCQVLLWQLFSSRDLQGGSCLVAMTGGYSVILARDYSIIVVGVHSVVTGASILSSGCVKAPLSLWCEVRLY